MLYRTVQEIQSLNKGALGGSRRKRERKSEQVLSALGTCWEEGPHTQIRHLMTPRASILTYLLYHFVVSIKVHVK